MNLLHFYFSNKEKIFYFNNIDLKEFLDVFSDMQILVINNLYGHSSKREYNELDFPKNIVVADFIMFKKENNFVYIDDFNFSVNSIQVGVSDENEYIITGTEPDFSRFVISLYKLLNINDDVWSEVQRKAGKYILIDDIKIINVFTSFDEFLQSKYSSMM